jgi:hypothetical protein
MSASIIPFVMSMSNIENAEVCMAFGIGIWVLHRTAVIGITALMAIFPTLSDYHSGRI